MKCSTRYSCGCSSEITTIKDIKVNADVYLQYRKNMLSMGVPPSFTHHIIENLFHNINSGLSEYMQETGEKDLQIGHVFGIVASFLPYTEFNIECESELSVSSATH